MPWANSRDRSDVGVASAEALADPVATWSMQVVLPVGWNAAGWAWYRLVNGVVQRRRGPRTFHVLVGAVVPEPILARLEAADNRVTGGVRMCGCMLCG